MKKVLPYLPNSSYSIYLKETIDRESPKTVAFDFYSINEFHDALLSSSSIVREEAKTVLDVVKYCRDRGVEMVFYGLKNNQKEKLYSKLESKKFFHSINSNMLSKAFKAYRAKDNPYWAQRSRSYSFYLKALRLNDRVFLKDPYKLHESVILEKYKSLPNDALILTNFLFYNNLRGIK